MKHQKSKKDRACVFNPYELAFCGFSHTGKTTLITRLIKELSLEHKIGISENGSYWFFVKGLSNHPDYFSFQADHMDKAQWFKNQYGFDVREFSRVHFGATVDNTPTAWAVLREKSMGNTCWEQTDTSYWCGSNPGKLYICGGPQPGDFEFWLYRKDTDDGLANSNTVCLKGSQIAAEVPSPASDHGYAYYNGVNLIASVRRTDQAGGGYLMYFDVNDAVHFANKVPVAAGGTHSYTIKVTFVNEGTDTLSLQYKNYAGTLITKTITKGTGLGTVDQWVDYEFRVDDAYFNNGFDGKADFRINSNSDGGNEFIHRVVVIPYEQ